MSADELERYLHDHIPLSKAMGVSVVSADPEAVVVGAPLAPNINHRETIFGGSASAVAILAAWSLLHLRLRAAAMESRVVIRSNSMEYDLPIGGAFTARSSLVEPNEWQPFLRTLSRRGKARLDVAAVLEYDGSVAGRLVGEFVALGRRG
jgi:thioesterase domain-containing protein